ncbi:hypothetical protein D9M71_727210 [compost metagenome]
MLGQHHIDVAQMVEDLAVQLLRYPLIETAITCLHMENRDLPTLGRDHRQASIGIAIEQKRVGLFQLENFIGLGDHLGNRLGSGIAGSAEEMIRFTNFQVVEKYLVQFEVVILP